MGVYSNNTWRNGAAQERSPAVHPSCLIKTGGPSRSSGSSQSSPFPLPCRPSLLPNPPSLLLILSATSRLADSVWNNCFNSSSLEHPHLPWAEFLWSGHKPVVHTPLPLCREGSMRLGSFHLEFRLGLCCMILSLLHDLPLQSQQRSFVVLDLIQDYSFLTFASCFDKHSRRQMIQSYWRIRYWMTKIINMFGYLWRNPCEMRMSGLSCLPPKISQDFSLCPFFFLRHIHQPIFISQGASVTLWNTHTQIVTYSNVCVCVCVCV